MPWVTSEQNMAFTGKADEVEIQWKKHDDAQPGESVVKCGQFTHTLDDAKTWAQNKADIDAKVASDEGLIQ